MKRLYENLLDEFLGMFPCVAIIGARQCGKTTLLHTLGGDWRTFDMERAADFEVVSHDPDLFFSLNRDYVAIDEAQLVPELFPALRVAIDANRAEAGRFVITGSSSPQLLRSISETLAGRIAIIEMSPLLWAETAGCTPSALTTALADGQRSPSMLVDGLSPRAGLDQAYDYWFRGGYPEPWLKDDIRFSRIWTDQYSQSYLQRDVARLFPGLDQTRFRRFLQMLGSLSGQVINISAVARAVGVSQPTARDYLEIAHGTFVWRTLPAFHHSTGKRIVKHAKGYMRDTGLLHHLLRLPDSDALLGHPQVGASWEGMVIEELIRQFNILGYPVDASFYRTGAGAEVDLICEGRHGMVPFEIKRGQRVDLRDLRGLRDFVDEQGCPVGIVINADTEPRLYSEKLIGVPFTCL